jgi:N-acyl-D-aspartate/D-glutamate deacylase
MDHLAELLEHPRTCLGLSDGGAHCGAICDASIPTYLLTHWARDRSRGRKVALEALVHTQTAKTAKLYGLEDRGQLAPGLLADINVVDHSALHLEAPRMAYDLPAEGRRLIQRARGYDLTLKNGQVTFEHGEPTGVLLGKLLRGRRPAPSA